VRNFAFQTRLRFCRRNASGVAVLSSEIFLLAFLLASIMNLFRVMIQFDSVSHAVTGVNHKRHDVHGFSLGRSFDHLSDGSLKQMWSSRRVFEVG
jgi:hypothetical protein